MLNVQIVCIGKLKESYWRLACNEYEKRMQSFAKFSIRELPECRLPENPNAAQIKAVLREEGEHILSECKNTQIVPLCIEGKEISSPDLAKWIENKAVSGVSSISFVIGSSFGLDDSVKESGNLRLSMSPMTFPHQLARVMLCEQIYRSFQILNHGKYHK